MKREPAVAGSFYPREKDRLSAMVEQLMNSSGLKTVAPRRAISYVAPHAGYAYSGRVAACTYRQIALRKDLDRSTFVIIGPNHTGEGTPLSISGADWITPLGIALNDTRLTEEIAAESDLIALDEEAHRHEHSIEVQIPFLQKLVENPRCCFICMGNQDYSSSQLLSKSVYNASRKLKRNIIVIASSDFDHYEPAKVAEMKDLPAIKALERIDTVKFNELLVESSDSACGYGPITTAALYARELGGKQGALLKYANSGDVTGDYDSVVAYSSIVFC